MKNKLICLLLVLGVGIMPIKTSAQLFELERLALDIEKLLQLKTVLSNLYKDYEILSNGYNTIKDISQGNFNLHKAFLDGLLAVSPSVRKYERVADIMGDQARIFSEYKTAYNLFKRDKHFSADELVYMSTVYDGLIRKSERNLENLLNVLTANKLRMNDAERLKSIDGIYSDTHDEIVFLRQFNSKTTKLAYTRAREQNDLESVRSLYGQE
ncbi:MAG TPA: hypothetical protein VK543_19370 [Puia sp.]|nr:hypothetical protein [Puia sp.]